MMMRQRWGQTRSSAIAGPRKAQVSVSVSARAMCPALPRSSRAVGLSVTAQAAPASAVSAAPPPTKAGWRDQAASPAKASSNLSAISFAAGKAEPLGPSAQANGINFAIFSKTAKTMKLCLFDEERKPIKELQLDAQKNKTGDVWHVLVEHLPLSGVLYGFRAMGDGPRFNPSRLLLDPYAPLVYGRKAFGQRDEVEQFEYRVGSTFYGSYDFESTPFDWGSDYRRPNLHQKDLVIYELTPRCFTSHPSSELPPGQRGTFKGIQAKVPYLADLGVNAVELLPVFEYDELEFQRRENPRDHMVNVWGYSHMSFMAPMARFAADAGGPKKAATEFKELVKTMHKAGIEVILDVVYNHTVEGDDVDPYTLSFRGLDATTYYMVDNSQPTPLLNITGCGNTVNANNPVVKKLIIDSLLRWVEEFHVDGFRFDLASCLCRGERGEPLPAPPLIREIATHPVLGKCKLIAEPWDLGMYQVGSFPNWDVWSEWNGRFRDDVRRFIKGDPGMKSAFATRLAGSSDLYRVNKRKPYHSINFINAHDGFSLYDLVAYNGKHNEANGENNNDGSNDNLSWNCGAEGPTQDAGVLALRARQQRNFMLALMVAQGTPMIVMGDECAFTHHGNNNWYGHDNDISQFKWGSANTNSDAAGLRRFVSELIKFRKEHPALGRADFIEHGDIIWHESHWDNPDSRFLAFTIRDPTQGYAGDLYVAFNAHHYQANITLPPPPHGCKWCRVVDTNLPSPKDFTPGGNAGVAPVYGIQAFSSIMLIAKKA